MSVLKRTTQSRGPTAPGQRADGPVRTRRQDGPAGDRVVDNASAAEPIAVAPLMEPAMRVAPGWAVFGVVLLGICGGVAAAKGLAGVGQTTVAGHVEAARLDLRGPASMVVETLVGEGDTVEPGAVIARVTPLETGEVAELRRRVRTLRDRQARLQSRFALELASRTRELDALVHRVEMAAAELIGELHASEIEQVALSDTLARGATGLPSGPLEALYTRSAVVPASAEAKTSEPDGQARVDTVIALEQAAARTEAYSARVDLCRDRLKTLRHERDGVESRLRTAFALAETDASVQRAEEALRAATAVREITSTGHGRVLIVPPVGTLVSEDEAVASLVDPVRRHVRARVPASVAVELEVGAEADLVFANGDRRRGRILRIAPGVTDGDLVGVVLEQSGKRWPVCPDGSSVRVDL